MCGSGDDRLLWEQDYVGSSPTTPTKIYHLSYMNTTVFVLLMLFGGTTTQSGMMVVQQEFNSFESCEAARIHIVSSVFNDYSSSYSMRLRAQGCFKK